MSTLITATIRQAEASDIDAIFVLLKAFAMSFTPDRAGFETSARHLLAD